MTAARGPASHLCPAGCGQPVPAHRLMCRTDWYRVPKLLRDTVWATWRNGLGAGSPEHTAAITTAVQSLGGTP